jgi:hypothetical protein
MKFVRELLPALVGVLILNLLTLTIVVSTTRTAQGAAVQNTTCTLGPCARTRCMFCLAGCDGGGNDLACCGAGTAMPFFACQVSAGGTCLPFNSIVTCSACAGYTLEGSLQNRCNPAKVCPPGTAVCDINTC